jgi:ribosomal protein S18 acetylase RimI-like enzyme
VKKRINIKKIEPENLEDLMKFFETNNLPEITNFFHPFPLNSATAHDIAHKKHRDGYYLARLNGNPVGFAMLRGWDEGYQTPSLGLFVTREQQGRGFGRQMVEFCILEAKRLGCPGIRLSVYESNASAVSLYQSLGFTEKNRKVVERKGVSDTKIDMLKPMK